jgi:hypothetical protein
VRIVYALALGTTAKGDSQALESRASTELLIVADQTFAEFTNSDYDVLGRMAWSGKRGPTIRAQSWYSFSTVKRLRPGSAYFGRKTSFGTGRLATQLNPSRRGSLQSIRGGNVTVADAWSTVLTSGWSRTSDFANEWKTQNWHYPPRSNA